MTTAASQPDLALLPQWYEYLAFEESKKDPGRIQVLYERLICHYCLVSVRVFFLLSRFFPLSFIDFLQEVWLKYLQYLDTNMRAVAAVVLPVMARAVRNCPWLASLWSTYIRALERYKKPQKEIDEVSCFYDVI